MNLRAFQVHNGSSLCLFKHLLSFIKLWALRFKIYFKYYGYNTHPVFIQVRAVINGWKFRKIRCLSSGVYSRFFFFLVCVCYYRLGVCSSYFHMAGNMWDGNSWRWPLFDFLIRGFVRCRELVPATWFFVISGQASTGLASYWFYSGVFLR